MVGVARNWCAARFPRRERECFFFGTGPPGIAIQSFRALPLDMPYTGSSVERVAVKVFLVLTQVHCFDGRQGVQEGAPSAVSLDAVARAGLVVAVDAAGRAEASAVGSAEETHRQTERDVLTRGLGQVENVVLVDYEVLLRVDVIEEPNAADGVESRNRLLIDRYLDGLYIRIEASSALGIDLRVQRGRYPHALVRPDEPDPAPDLDQVAAERDMVFDSVLPGGAAGLTNKLRNVKVHSDTDSFGIEQAQVA